MLTCRGCVTKFIPKRKGQEYHNRKCFLKATIRFLTCPQCGIEFRKKFSKQACCTPECANAYRARKKTKGIFVPCSFNGKLVYKMQSRVRRLNFCDNVCKIAYLRSDKNTDKRRRHTPEEIEKIKQANLNKDYDLIFTNKTRQKFRENARRTILRPDIIEKTKELNRLRLTGSRLPEATKQKIKLNAKYGKDNHMWKEIPSNEAIHDWARKNLPSPKICVRYDPTGKDPCSKQMEASSKGNEHLRDITTWEWLCTHHHDEYELQYGLVNPHGKIARIYAKFGNVRKRDFTVDGLIVEGTNSYQASST